MGRRTRDIVEAVLFLPAMALLAGLTFVAFYLVYLIGNWLAWHWFLLFRVVIGLPKPLAILGSLIGTIFCVYGAWWTLFERRVPFRKRV